MNFSRERDLVHRRQSRLPKILVSFWIMGIRTSQSQRLCVENHNTQGPHFKFCLLYTQSWTADFKKKKNQVCLKLKNIKFDRTWPFNHNFVKISTQA